MKSHITITTCHTLFDYLHVMIGKLAISGQYAVLLVICASLYLFSEVNICFLWSSLPDSCFVNYLWSVPSMLTCSARFTKGFSVHYPNPVNIFVAVMQKIIHDNVIKSKHFPRYWSFVRGIHRSPVNSPHKGQWREALMFSLICHWINGWVSNGEAGDLRRHCSHYDVSVIHPTTPHKHMQWQLNYRDN